MTNKNYKAFLFCHTALKQVCGGVQNAHVLPEMFVKYQDESRERKVLFDWAAGHKTIVMRDGGISKSLKQIRYVVARVCPVLQVPYSCFYESDDYMDGILTSVGFVLDRSRQQVKLYDRSTSVDSIAKELHNIISTRHLQEQEVYDMLVALIDATRPL